MRRPSAVMFVLAVLLGGTSACRRSKDAQVARDRDEPNAAPAPSRRNECAIAGRLKVDGAAPLSAHRDGESMFASFADAAVDFETTEVPTLGGARVRVLAKVRFGFALEGWIESGRLDFAAARTIELAGKTAYVPRGARLTLVLGAGRSVIVSPITQDLAHLDVLVDCDAVAIGAVPHAPFAGVTVSGATSTEKILAFGGSTLPISASPGGDAVFTLQGGSGLRVPIVETKEGLHIHYEDGIVVDGWVRREDLVVPTSLRVHPLRCGMGAAITTIETGLVAPGVARRDAPILVGSTPLGAPRGSLVAGGKVMVLSTTSGFAEVAPLCGELKPSAKNHFFIEASALDIGPAVPVESVRAACR